MADPVSATSVPLLQMEIPGLHIGHERLHQEKALLSTLSRGNPHPGPEITGGMLPTTQVSDRAGAPLYLRTELPVQPLVWVPSVSPGTGAD